MATLFRIMMARIRGFLRPGDLDQDFTEELESHLAMAEDEKIRQGMSRQEARRMARVELGGLTQLREAGREARGLPLLDTFWLDVKLGLRMLRKSWGLTLVGGLAMTVAISIAVVVFAFLDIALSDNLPLVDGDRVVALETWGERTGRHKTSLPDFERWRDGLRSVEDIGAFQTAQRNLILGNGPLDGGQVRPVSIAEMTASGFQLAQVPPLLGRPLTPADERDDASPVVVIGYDVWQSWFSADPEILGQTVRLGNTVHTVVGVMPEGFAFPVNHNLWTPLRPDRSVTPQAEESLDVVFARLAPGVTPEGAQAELATLGLLPLTHLSPAGATAPEANEERQARVVTYTSAFSDSGERWFARVVMFFVTLLLIPPCANIAILVYARTVTRQEEFTARYVLGASRSRIVAQIFVEVLVLAAAASVVALAIVAEITRRIRDWNPEAPFWVEINVSFKTMLFAAGLAVVAALIAGAVPALKATGRQMQSGIRSLGSRTGLRLGATWTALVVVQVAFSAAALPSAIEMAWGTVRNGILGPGFAAEEYLTAKISTDRIDLQTELIRRLEAEAGISGVTAAAAVPGDAPWGSIEVEGVPLQRKGLIAGDSQVRANHVDNVFFDVFNVPVLVGRGFNPGDFESDRNVVIVNRTLVDTLMDTNPLGRRLRYTRRGDGEASEPPTWYEVIGVVGDLPENKDRGTLYHPLIPGQTHPISLALHTEATPASVANRLREVAAALDPTLRVEEVFALDEIYRGKAVGNNLGALALGLATLAVLLLSAAGIYALMSFTVNQRRREIGIRAALGAQPGHLLKGLFRRALGQLAIGAGSGVLVALLLSYYLPTKVLGGWEVPGVVPAAATLMMVIGLLATAGPARRGLRVDPIEELREG